MNGRLYSVTWIQLHEARLRARDREEAKLVGVHMHDRDTLVCVRNLYAREVKK